MRLHPYPFKWRAFRHWGGLLVMILRHMRKAAELDVKIADSCSMIDKHEEELEALKSKLNSVAKEVKTKDIRANKKLKVEQKGRNVKKQINKKMRIIEIKKREVKKDVVAFCKSVKAELKEFTRNDVDDYTLLYKGSRYLRGLAELLIKSKNIDARKRETLKRGIIREMQIIVRKAQDLELQAKHLERGGVNTVVLSEISPWGSRWIEARIKRKAIEVNALHDRLKSGKGEDLFEDFEKEIIDIYDIGRNTSILMRRLKMTFNSIRSRLKNGGISYPELNKTERFFEKSFRRMEKMGIWLKIEMKDQASELVSELKAA